MDNAQKANPILEAAITHAIQGGCTGWPMTPKEADKLRKKVLAVGTPFEDIPGRTMVADEVGDDREPGTFVETPDGYLINLPSPASARIATWTPRLSRSSRATRKAAPEDSEAFRACGFEVADESARLVLATLGLADRVWGNQPKSEQVTA